MQPPSNNPKTKKLLLSVLLWAALTFLFLLVLGGFTSNAEGNQTTKLLFGMADAGVGYLDQDWMANTIDPLPVFSWIVEFTYRYLGEWVFYVYVFLLLGIYLYSVMMILDHFFQINQSALLFFMAIALFLLSYSNIWSLPVKDWLQYGVAYQNLSLPRFLPNAFAVLFFPSILLFLKKRPYWAVVVLALACNIHTGYMIIGAVLVSAYLIADLWENRDLKRVLMIGGLALILVLPIVVIFVFANQGASAAQIAEANHIVANLRIPHHTQVSVWWGRSAMVKLVLVLAAIVVMRRTKMLPILVIGFLMTYGPALVLIIRPSNRIALLQLWRVSVILVPLASALLIGALVSLVYRKFEGSLLRWRWVIVVLLSGLVAVTLAFGTGKWIERVSGYGKLPGSGLMGYVEEHGGSGEIYLIPPKDDALEPFRVVTGEPVYVNWKSHPWNTLELLEWYRRMGVAEEFYAAAAEERCAMLAGELAGITHVVLPEGETLDCPLVERTFANQAYSLYLLQP